MSTSSRTFKLTLAIFALGAISVAGYASPWSQFLAAIGVSKSVSAETVSITEPQRANLMAPLSGTYNIPGDYPTLDAAITDLNTQGVGGAVTLNLVAGNPQTAPSGGYVVGGTGSLVLTTTSASNTVTIQGNGNTITASAAQTAGNLNDGIFKLIGADYITITGFTMIENPANTVTTAASNNMTEWGIGLLYVTTTDGAQNDTIQGNTIDLDRTYQNTFGIYANATHSATAVTTSATATGPAGGNSGLIITANGITDVNIGIVVVGPTAAADNNDGITVGGTAPNANTLTNFGTTGTFSGYANVSGTVNGILVRNSKNFTVSFNSLTSSAGGVTAGTLNGIQIPASSTSPTGTFTNNINNNTISLQSGSATGGINGINIPSGTGSTTSTLNVNNNNFTQLNHSVAASGTIVAITNSGSATVGPLVTSISNNTFTNLNTSTTGSFTFISDSFTAPTNGIKNVSNNSIVTGFNKTGAGGTVTLFTDNGSDTAGTINNSNNNNFSNVSITGATTLTGISNTNGGTPNKSVNNNTVSNITGGSSSITPIAINFDGGTTTATGNLVTNVTGSGAITGISVGSSGAGTTNFSQNTVNTLTGTGTGVVTGISVGGTTSTIKNVFRNKIYNLENNNAGGSTIGLTLASGTTLNVFNNLIGDLRTPAVSAANALIGINITSTTATSNVNLSFNTVYLNGTSAGANFGSSALFATTSATATTADLVLKDNILVNTSTAAGTGFTAAYRRSSTTLTNFDTASNNNDFYAGTPGATNLIFYDGTNSDLTLAGYKSRVSPRDAASITENPPFISTSGSDVNFLHISAVSPTQLESGGISVAGITDDFDGNTRNVTTPDVGADEFTGVPIDLNPPSITYTAFNNTSLTTNRTLSAAIIDPSGVAGGALSPRIYFRKNGGSYFSTQCTGSYSCVIDYSLVGDVVVGDTINYFVIAQDSAGNVGGNPGGGLVATDVNNVTTPPNSPNTFSIISAVPASVNVGTGETYTSLTNNDAGGLFNAINNGVLAGNVTINITSDLLAETGTVALNEWAEDGASGYTLTIKPLGGSRVISGSSTNSIIRLNGADRVMIEGSLTGSTAADLVGGDPSLRNLTIQNTSTTATAGAVIAFMSGANGAAQDTVRNTNIVGQDPTQTLIGVHLGGNTVGSAGTDNDNNRVENCGFQKTFIGIYDAGASAANQNLQNVITKNDLSATGPNRLRRAGMLYFNHNQLQVTLNSIGGIADDESGDAYGIGLGIQSFDTTNTSSGAITNSLVSQNRINGLASTSTTGFSAIGIGIAGGSTGSNVISNNMISGVTAPSTSPDIVAGIYVAGAAGSNTKLYFNSVSLTGDRGAVASQIGSYGLAATGTDPTLELKDNIFYTIQTSGGGANAKSYAVGMVTTTFANLDSNYNDFVSTGANAGGFRTGGLGATANDLATLAAWQAAVSDDANSTASDPTFVDPLTNLHLINGSPMTDSGVSAGGIIVDFDNDPRYSPPEIGADEFPDLSPPDTSIDTHPANPSNSNSATFTFSGTDTGGSGLAGFECQLDGSMFSSCTSPQTYMGLSQGSHTFNVRAKDNAGNIDPTPATFTWFLDAISPDTSILTHPSDPSSSPDATFTFSGTDSLLGNPLTFECKLDMDAFAECTSPKTYVGLADGMHTFQVRAKDSVGNIDPTPASFTWTISTGSVGGPVRVTATAGTTGPTDYMTLKDAVDAINAGTHQGDVTISIVTSTVEAAAPIVLNGSGAGPALYTSVVIRPAADGISVTGATPIGRGLIELNGADNVTIDGDNPSSTGTNRDLTLQNTAANTVTFTSVVRLALATTVITSTDNVVVKNLNIAGSATGRNIAAATSTTASENTTFGIFAGPGASTVSNTTAPSAVTSVSTSIGAGATASNLIVSNNNVTTAGRAISMNGSATTVFPGLQITGNQIGNSTVGAADQVYSIGITAQGSANGVISGNSVWVEGYIASSTATHGIEVGVNSATGTFTIDSNKVNRVKNNNGQTWSAIGINLGGGSNHVVQNNFVSGMINSQTAGTGGFGTTFGAYGIRISSGTGHKVYHNSVHLYDPLPGTTSTDLTAAFMITANTLTGIDVRNNIFSNQVAGGNPTGTRNVAVFLPSAATSAMNLTWNNNAYFVGTDALNRLAQVGTTFGTGEYQASDFDPTQTTPATNFRAYTSTLSGAGTNDNASFATIATPPFTSNTDLHIPATTATRLESGGAAVGVAVDIDTDLRNATTPDIGADEFAGQPPAANDIAATSFVVPANGSTIPTGSMFGPQAKFINNGTAAQMNVTVRFKIFDPMMATIYDQTATISMIAPLQAVTVTFPSTSIATPGAHTMQASAELAGDSIPGNDTINGGFNAVVPIGGTVTVGAGGTYTSLTNAGGLFEALNLAGISSDLTVNITSDLTTETGAVVLNQLVEAGAGGYTVTIKPSGAARVISGTSASSSALITLNGADRIVIDGSLSGGTDRSLAITNNQATTTSVIWLRSPNASNGATNNTIRNCVINGAAGPNSTTTAGILTGSGTTLGNDAEAPNSNNTVQNNWIYRVQNSMYLRGGTSAPTFDQNWTVVGNELGSSNANDKNIFRGMLIGNSKNFVVSGNTVHGIQSTGTTAALMSGIQLALLLDTGTVTNNKISDVKNVSASGTGASGISVIATSTASGVTIANNFISDVAANGSATIGSNGHGMSFFGSGTGYSVYFNSVNMTTNQATAQTSAAMFVNSTFATAGAIDLRDNVLVNNETTGSRYAVYCLAASSVFSTIDYNDYFSQNVGFIGGSNRVTLADWQTATGQDINSRSVDPLFVSSTDLHIQNASPVKNVGVAIAGITTDIDGDLRDAAPDLGADENLSTLPGSLQFSSATYSSSESVGTAAVTVTRTGGSDGTVGISYATSDGTATGGASCTPGVDYVSTSGTLSFATGETSKTFNVTICNDSTIEPDETINYTLSAPTGGAVLGSPSTAVQTITNDDVQLGTFSVNDVRISEGNSGLSNVVFTVTYAGSVLPGSVQYATADGTATTIGLDYGQASGTLNFATAGTQTVSILIVGDTLKEANETFFLNLSNPVNGTLSDAQGVGVIVDDDRSAISDFDRDLTADVSVFRPSDGRWYILQTTNATPRVIDFGTTSDRPVPGDYDGDGKTDLAYWRASTGQWTIMFSGTSTTVIVPFGGNGDKPAQGDYDGDGKTDVAVYRPSTGTWWILHSVDGSTSAVQFGLAADLPVQGDYDGDAKTDIAVYRDGTWYIWQSSNGQIAIANFGLPGDKPVSGDFDGDGRYDLAIFRNGDWWIYNSLTGSVTSLVWGLSTDIPAPADYDHDGTTDITVFRPSNGDWYILKSSNGASVQLHWGSNGDIPIPSAYLSQ